MITDTWGLALSVGIRSNSNSFGDITVQSYRGNWLLEINYWRLIAGNWLLEIDCWKLIAGNCLREIDCWKLNAYLCIVMMPSAKSNSTCALCMVWELCEPACFFSNLWAQLCHSSINKSSCWFLHFMYRAGKDTPLKDLATNPIF